MFDCSATHIVLIANGCITGTVYVNVSVDGNEEYARVGLTAKDGWTKVIDGLENKFHTIKISRSSEASHGKMYLRKIRTDKTKPTPTLCLGN